MRIKALVEARAGEVRQIGRCLKVVWDSAASSRYSGVNLGEKNYGHIYHGEGEGDDGITIGAREAAGTDAGAVIGKVTGVGRSQSGKDGEGENVFHFENI